MTDPRTSRICTAHFGLIEVKFVGLQRGMGKEIFILRQLRRIPEYVIEFSNIYPVYLLSCVRLSTSYKICSVMVTQYLHNESP